MEDGRDWVMVTDEDGVRAFCKSNVNAVKPDYIDPKFSYVVAGKEIFRFKGDVKSVLRDVLDVDITTGTPPKHVTSQKSSVDICWAAKKPLQS